MAVIPKLGKNTTKNELLDNIPTKHRFKNSQQNTCKLSKDLHQKDYLP